MLWDLRKNGNMRTIIKPAKTQRSQDLERKVVNIIK